jgi:hypothetical protein
MRFILSAAALLFGIVFAICEVFGTYEYLHQDQGGITYVVVAGAAIAAAISLLPAWATFAWRGRPGLSLAIWLIFIVALGSVIASALARTGTATDIAQERREQIEKKEGQAARAVADAGRRLDLANDALDKANNDVIENASKKGCATNCAALLSAAVVRAEQEVKAVRIGLDAAQRVEVSAPVGKTDSLAKRVAALLPVSEDAVRLYQPLIVPTLTSALSAVLTALGIWGLGCWWQAKNTTRGEESRALALADKGASIVREPASGEGAAPLASEDVPPPAQPRAIAPPVDLPTTPFNETGSKLASFAGHKIIRAPGTELSMRDALAAYQMDCARERVRPLDPRTFTRELAMLCQEAGVRVRVEGKDAFLIGATLAA